MTVRLLTVRTDRLYTQGNISSTYFWLNLGPQPSSEEFYINENFQLYIGNSFLTH